MLKATHARRKLEALQEQELRSLLIGSLPDDHGFPERLWEKEVVRRVVAARTGLVLAQRTLSTYLERWGFFPEKPLRAAHRAQPSLMRAWMRTDYPVIAYETRESNGELYWAAWSPLVPKVHVPRRADPGAAPSRSWHQAPTSHVLLFLVSNRGHLQWIVRPHDPRPEDAVELIQRALAGRSRKLHLIAPDDAAFRSKEISELVAGRPHEVAIRYLLPHAARDEQSGSHRPTAAFG